MGDGITLQIGEAVVRLATDRLYPALDTLRDRIFDTWVMEGAGAITANDAREAVAALLAIHHPELADDSDPEFSDRITSALLDVDLAVLRPLVLLCLFGSQLITARSHGYSDWARSALRANGIDPASLDALEAADVLKHLVATGRAIPQADWIDAISAAATVGP